MMSNSVFEKIQVANHLFVFYQGELIYKRWYDTRNPPHKSESSMLFNSNGFPSQKITDHVEKELYDE